MFSSMINSSKYLCIVLTAVVIYHVTLATKAESPIYSGNAEKILIAEVLSKLEEIAGQYARPVKKATDRLDVSFQISPIHILDFDEKNQLLTTMMWIDMWRMSGIEWDPAQYDGVTELILPPHLIWTPDVMLYNRVDTPSSKSSNWVVLYSDGSVTWIPCVVYVSVCPVNMENFPYDVQNCPFKFGSWSFSDSKLNLTLNAVTEGLDRSQYKESMEWTLQDVSVTRTSQKYECCADSFVSINYVFVLARHSAFYTQFLILPVVMLGIVILAIFWIPPSRPDRTGLGMSLFASFMLLLLLVVQISPPSKTIKLITYCAINIILTATATVLSACIVNISQTTKPAPSLLVKILRKIHREKKGPRTTAQTQEEGEPVSLSMMSNTGPQEHYRGEAHISHRKHWIQLSMLLDRVFFVVYFIVILTTLVVFLPMPL